MPRHDAAPLGAPCWIDLSTSDPAKAQEFYGRLFGWTAERAGEEYGGYITFAKDGLPVAGCMSNEGQSVPFDFWSVYLATDDVRATTEAAAAHGGEVLLPAMEVLETGSMAIVNDAGQAAIGAWQPGTHKGFGIVAEPGAPAWFELHTRDYDASVEFYREVFGWDTHVMEDSPAFRYTTLGKGDAALAGIMDAAEMLPEGAPATWQIYFAVDDTDAALVRVVELGGSVVLPVDDSPFGRLAQVADPTGALFKLVSAPNA